LTERVLRVALGSEWSCTLQEMDACGRFLPSFLVSTAKGTRVGMEKLSSSFTIAELFRALKAVRNFAVEGGREMHKGDDQ
jgi:hypothetical protein